jgi:hypothetical protein
MNECSPRHDPLLLNPNDEFYRNQIRFCPYCLVMMWHLHPCHHENDTSSKAS